MLSSTVCSRWRPNGGLAFSYNLDHEQLAYLNLGPLLISLLGNKAFNMSKVFIRKAIFLVALSFSIYSMASNGGLAFLVAWAQLNLGPYLIMLLGTRVLNTSKATNR